MSATSRVNEIARLDDACHVLGDRLRKTVRALIQVEDRRAELLCAEIALSRTTPTIARHDEAAGARRVADALTSILVELERIDGDRAPAGAAHMVTVL